jgi:hypothetical protein
MDRRFNITRLGVCVPGDVDLTKIKSKLTVTNVGYNKRVIKKQSWTTDRASKKVYLARAAGIQLLKRYVPGIQFNNLIGDGTDIPPGVCTLQYNDMQQAIFAYLMQTVFTDANRADASSTCIVNMPAGQGKTFLATGFIEHFRKKTLIVVPDETLLDQWYNHICAMFPETRVGMHYSKKKIDGDIIVGSIGSLLGDTITYKPHPATGEKKAITVPSKEWYRHFGFTVFDEIHMYCSPVRSEIFKKACSTLTMGMSATTSDRLDNMDPIAHHFVGTPIEIIKLQVIKDLIAKATTVPFRLTAKIVEYHGPPEYTQPLVSTEGTISAPLMINQFAQDPYRTMVIMREIVRLYNEGHCVFVFVDRRELVTDFVKLMKVYLRQMVTGANMNDIIAPQLDGAIEDDIEPIDTEEKDTFEAIAIRGGVTKEARNAARDTSRICCLTYACGSVGLSYPRYTSMVLATPRRNGFKQILNRIFRLGSKVDVEREAVFIRDYKTSLKDQVSGFKSVAKNERNVKKFVTEIVHWQDVKKFDAMVATNPELRVDEIERKLDSVTL